MKSVLRDHCHERLPVLKDHILLIGPIHVFQCNWTCHQRPSVLRDHIFMANGVVFQDWFCCTWDLQIFTKTRNLSEIFQRYSIHHLYFFLLLPRTIYAWLLPRTWMSPWQPLLSSTSSTTVSVAMKRGHENTPCCSNIPPMEEYPGTHSKISMMKICSKTEGIYSSFWNIGMKIAWWTTRYNRSF